MVQQVKKDDENKLSRYFAQPMSINPLAAGLEEFIRNTANKLRKAALEWANALCGYQSFRTL